MEKPTKFTVSYYNYVECVAYLNEKYQKNFSLYNFWDEWEVHGTSEDGQVTFTESSLDRLPAHYTLWFEEFGDRGKHEQTIDLWVD